jgi:hypothetical protein
MIQSKNIKFKNKPKKKKMIYYFFFIKKLILFFNLFFRNKNEFDKSNKVIKNGNTSLLENNKDEE